MPSTARPAPPRRVNLLIDLNGTCHVGEQQTPGAVDALRKLRQLQRRQQRASSGGVASPSSPPSPSIGIRFCSNTTKESTSSLLSKLRRVGFGDDLIVESDLFTSLDATSRYVERCGLSPLLLLSESAQTAFRRDAALESRCFFASPGTPPSLLHDDQKRALMRCDAVVVGLCPQLMTQAWLDEAFRLISGEYVGRGGSQKARLIATHRALYHRPSTDSPLSLGPGAFIAALEAAARLDASTTTICGKPSRTFLQECLGGLEREGPGRDGDGDGQGDAATTTKTKNVIIGDDVEADLGGDTTLLELERVLVRTGKYRKGDEDGAAQRSPPDATFDTFAEWVDAFVAEVERRGVAE
ncbi:uncharacterized protein PFL1_02672 [Pseudozyma flocculosa PF-1]|uniref:Uncharacterized protein n=2 Tax=Pseudozyma flocculosa TaxID=84751 RepID=A0A5C3EZR0_9BASI|nr:uncharacterized protein PFL1_02672 [Pseudozyma flocculosa PF-1]EPQ29999.1 hypothetical protein PFL1_02672 [Pseudozyma flocculosa PF-1]SPO37320.1 uncharacterized protein PSFLO_02793 [Pseudozyma flocculosa]